MNLTFNNLPLYSIIMKIITVLLFVFFFKTGVGQTAPVTYKIIYMDTAYMQRNAKSDDWSLKEGIGDGMWIVYYDSSMIDTALTATVQKGILEGRLKIYDRIKHYLYWDFNYKEGKKHGYCYVHNYYFAEDGDVLYKGDSIYIETFKIKYVEGLYDGEEILHQSIKFTK